MKELTIGNNEKNQRVDKFLAKYLDKAPKSFIYKMIRKKNITLNGKKFQGNEILNQGDVIKIFFSDETLEKFTKGKVIDTSNPVRSGTRTVAPNMANRCCTPSISMRGAPN